jgi:hypothetical protein
MLSLVVAKCKNHLSFDENWEEFSKKMISKFLKQEIGSA